MSQFLSASEIKRIDPNEIDLSEYNNSSTGSVLEVKYPKRLCELHNDYLLAPDYIEIKRETLKVKDT